MALGPTCSVRFYIGAGVPGDVGRYKKLPVAFDDQTFRETVEAMVKKKFANATFFKTRGVWQGGSEDGYMVEVVMSPSGGSCLAIFQRAEVLAKDIAFAFGQEAVLLIATDDAGRVEHGLIEAA
jgi:hypothetical protein